MIKSEPCGINMGKLRQDVTVVLGETSAKLRFAHWETSLPIAWIKAHPAVEDLLQRRVTLAQAMKSPETMPLVRLLSAQGCFLPEAKSFYSLREVKELFDPLRSQWYAAYYAHPVWNFLRHGEAHRGAVLGWLVHNYHISRAAGVVAARTSAMGPFADWSDFFERDALSEFWHCDAYYSLNVPAMRDVSQQEIYAYTPLSASLAFEDHTLQVAETNSLGHVLIAYFQESSIAFETDSKRFYEQVEAHYDMQGLFTPWKQHMQIDIDNSHADGLAQLLNSERQVPVSELQRSLRDAWLAYYFLHSGLDDILHSNQNEENVDLRSPLTRYDADRSQLEQLTNPDEAYLRIALHRSAIRALGFARDHFHIIACGRIAKALGRFAQPEDIGPSDNPWCVAIANRLMEAAASPSVWHTLARHTATRLNVQSVEPPSANELNSMPTHVFQLDELLRRLASDTDRIPNDLLFR